MYVVFTKSDLITDKNQYELMEEIIKQENIEEIWYTSSKTGENINKLFENIAKYTLICPPSVEYYKNNDILPIDSEEEGGIHKCSTCWS